MIPRVVVSMVLFITGALFCANLPTTHAQTGAKGKDKNDNEVRKLKADIAELQQKNNVFQAALKKEKNDGDDKIIQLLKQKVLLEEKAVQQLRAQLIALEKQAVGFKAIAEQMQNAKSVVVITWAGKPAVGPTEQATLASNAITSIAKMRGVRGVWAGPEEVASRTDAVSYVKAIVLLDTATTSKSFKDGEQLKTFLDQQKKDWMPAEFRIINMK